MSPLFYVLGTSSGLPVADKATSGYLLKTDNSLSLIDCGGGVVQSFLKRGFNPLDIDRIFISHTHSDHVCELSLFLQMIYLHKRTKTLDLFLPGEFIEPFKNYLNAVYLIEEKFSFKLNYHSIEDGLVCKNNRFEIKAILNDHLQGYTDLIKNNNLPNKMQSYSFLIKTEEKSILYSSDLGTLKPIESYFQGLDYLLIETTHISMDSLIQSTSDKNIKQIIATHLGSKDEMLSYAQTAFEKGQFDLIVAIDGMEIQL